MLKHLRKNLTFAIWVHLFFWLPSFIFFVLSISRKDILLLIICISTLVLGIVSFIISLYTWNLKIYFDDEKIYYKYRGEKYVWKWDEITSCTSKMRLMASRNPLSFYIEIVTDPSYKKLIFEHSPHRERFLLAICPLENIKKIIEEGLNKE